MIRFGSGKRTDSTTSMAISYATCLEATVDLPHPDSPTNPIASPGITVQEKSITAGISNNRVKNEIERLVISRIGPSYGSFMSLS